VPPPPHSTPFPYTTLFRSRGNRRDQFPDSRIERRIARTRLGLSLARLGLPLFSQPFVLHHVVRHGLYDACERNETAAQRQHAVRSEEHTSELQSPDHLVCR